MCVHDRQFDVAPMKNYEHELVQKNKRRTKQKSWANGDQILLHLLMIEEKK